MIRLDFDTKNVLAKEVKEVHLALLLMVWRLAKLAIFTTNGDFESKFEFIYEDGKLADIKIIKTRNQLNEKQTKDSLKFIKKYHKQISEKWYEFFLLNKTSKCRKITTKL